MQRRAFLQCSISATVLPFAVPPLTADSPSPAALPDKGILVRSGQDRSDKPFHFLDADFYVKVSGKDNEGRCVIFDTIRHKKVGPTLHIHTDLDEWFWVIDGEFKFQAGEEILRLKAGDSLFVPRNVQHAFVKTSEGPARLIVMHQPAGTMEEYFRLVSQMPDNGFESRRSLAEQHGMRFVGAPLKPD